MYTLEMAYAHMRQLQELANRSRAHQPAERPTGPRTRLARHAKKH